MTFVAALTETLFFYDPEVRSEGGQPNLSVLFVLPKPPSNAPVISAAKPLFSVVDSAGTFLGRVMGEWKNGVVQVIAEPVLLPRQTQAQQIILVPLDAGLGATSVTLSLGNEEAALSDGQLSALASRQGDGEDAGVFLSDPEDLPSGDLAGRLNRALAAQDPENVDAWLVAAGTLRRESENKIAIAPTCYGRRRLSETPDDPEDKPRAAPLITLQVQSGPSQEERELLPLPGVARSTRRDLRVSLLPENRAAFRELSLDDREKLVCNLADVALWTDMHVLPARRFLATEPDALEGDILAPNAWRVFKPNACRALLSQIESVLRAAADFDTETLETEPELAFCKGIISGLENGDAVPPDVFSRLFFRARASADRRARRQTVSEAPARHTASGERSTGPRSRMDRAYDRYYDGRFLQVLAEKARQAAIEGNGEDYQVARAIVRRLFQTAMERLDRDTRVGFETQALPLAVFDQVRLEFLKHLAKETEFPPGEGPHLKAGEAAIVDGLSGESSDDGHFVVGPFGHLSVEEAAEVSPRDERTYEGQRGFLTWLFAQTQGLLHPSDSGQKAKRRDMNRPDGKAQRARIWEALIIGQRQDARAMETAQRQAMTASGLSQRRRIRTDPLAPKNNPFWKDMNARSLVNRPENPLHWSANEFFPNNTGAAPIADGASDRLERILGLRGRSDAETTLFPWAEIRYPFEVSDAVQTVLQIHEDWFNLRVERQFSKIIEALTTRWRTYPTDLGAVAELASFKGHEPALVDYLLGAPQDRGLRFDALMSATGKGAEPLARQLSRFLAWAIEDLRLLNEILESTPNWLTGLKRFSKLPSWLAGHPNSSGLRYTLWDSLSDDIEARIAVFTLGKHLQEKAPSGSTISASVALSHLFRATPEARELKLNLPSAQALKDFETTGVRYAWATLPAEDDKVAAYTFAEILGMAGVTGGSKRQHVTEIIRRRAVGPKTAKASIKAFWTELLIFFAP